MVHAWRERTQAPAWRADAALRAQQTRELGERGRVQALGSDGGTQGPELEAEAGPGRHSSERTPSGPAEPLLEQDRATLLQGNEQYARRPRAAQQSSSRRIESKELSQDSVQGAVQSIQSQEAHPDKQVTAEAFESPRASDGTQPQVVQGPNNLRRRPANLVQMETSTGRGE